jgi:hypothetical protein
MMFVHGHPFRTSDDPWNVVTSPLGIGHLNTSKYLSREIKTKVEIPHRVSSPPVDPSMLKDKTRAWLTLHNLRALWNAPLTLDVS